MSETDDTPNVAVAKAYFRTVDAGGDPTPLFHEKLDFYYPKFGRTVGTAAFGEFVGGIMGTLQSIAHPIETMAFTEQGDTVVVEGLMRGQTATGERWQGGETPAGRFCSVFAIRDGRIQRMHIYVDPDYGSRNAEGFVWGRDRSW